MYRHTLLIPAALASILALPTFAVADHRVDRVTAFGAFVDPPTVVRADVRHAEYLDVRHDGHRDRRKHRKHHRQDDRHVRRGHDARIDRFRRLGPVFAYGLRPGVGHGRFRHHRGPGHRHRHFVPHRHAPRRHAPRPRYGWSLWLRW